MADLNGVVAPGGTNRCCGHQKVDSMSIDLGEKVKPLFAETQFDWFVKNGISGFLKLNGKRPAEGGRRKGTYKFSSISKHIQGGFNIGVLIPHGVVVLDVDTRDDGFANFDRLLADAYQGEPWAPSLDDLIKSTFTVRTGGGGLHLYYSHDPTVRARGSLRGYSGVDLKSSNAGYVVAPGSIHPDTGRAYTVENMPDAFAELPAPLAPFVLTQIHDPFEAQAQPNGGHPLWGIITSGELSTLLASLDPLQYRPYDQWFALLAASHHASGGSHEAMITFIEWSEGDAEFLGKVAGEVAKKWRGLSEVRDASKPVATVDTLLSAVANAVKVAHEAEELLGEPDEIVTCAAALVRDIRSREGAKDLEPLGDTESGNLLAWIESPVGDSLQDDPKALAEIIARVSKEPDINWPELCAALSARIDGRHSPLKIQRLVQKEATRRQKEEKDKLPTYAETVELITEASIKELAKSKDDLLAPPSGQVFKYEAGCWQEQADNAVNVSTWKVIKNIVDTRSKSAKPLNKYAADADDCVFREISTTSKELYEKSKPPHCINVSNGTLWFDKDGGYILKPHSRSDMLTTIFDYPYDPYAICPSMDKMLTQVFDNIAKRHSVEERDAFIAHWWELIGFAIQPVKEVPVMMFWIGRGQNGKSKISDIIKCLVGSKAVLPKRIDKIFNLQDNHGMASLEGKRLIITDDLNHRTLLSDGDLKTISQNTMLEVNPKNKPQKNIWTEATPIIMSNRAPRLLDTTDGFQRRVFAAYFEDNIKHLQNSPLPKIALAHEMSGILNRAVQGYSRYRKRGDFELPKSAHEFRVRFLAASNTILAFWESLDKHPSDEALVSTSDLYDRYRAWMTMEGTDKPQCREDFIEALIGQKVIVDSMFVTGWSIAPQKNEGKGQSYV
jgi:P4 family phage/plasmid primase-like protien